jgi:hypothetical protein
MPAFTGLAPPLLTVDLAFLRLALAGFFLRPKDAGFFLLIPRNIFIDVFPFCLLFVVKLAGTIYI